MGVGLRVRLARMALAPTGSALGGYAAIADFLEQCCLNQKRRAGVKPRPFSLLSIYIRISSRTFLLDLSAI